MTKPKQIKNKLLINEKFVLSQYFSILHLILKMRNRLVLFTLKLLRQSILLQPYDKFYLSGLLMNAYEQTLLLLYTLYHLQTLEAKVQ